jgi:hypothetical protein
MVGTVTVVPDAFTMEPLVNPNGWPATLVYVPLE